MSNAEEVLARGGRVVMISDAAGVARLHDRLFLASRSRPARRLSHRCSTRSRSSSSPTTPRCSRAPMSTSRAIWRKALRSSDRSRIGRTPVVFSPSWPGLTPPREHTRHVRIHKLRVIGLAQQDGANPLFAHPLAVGQPNADALQWRWIRSCVGGICDRRSGEHTRPSAAVSIGLSDWAQESAHWQGASWPLTPQTGGLRQVPPS
jgi:hypothetical protein